MTLVRPLVLLGVASYAAAAIWFLSATGKTIDPTETFARFDIVSSQRAEGWTRALVFVEACLAGACVVRSRVSALHWTGLLLATAFAISTISSDASLPCGCGLEVWTGPGLPKWMGSGVLVGAHGCALWAVHRVVPASCEGLTESEFKRVERESAHRGVAHAHSCRTREG